MFGTFRQEQGHSNDDRQHVRESGESSSDQAWYRCSRAFGDEVSWWSSRFDRRRNRWTTLVPRGCLGLLGRSKGIRTMIDNTFASPVNQVPINLGIDVVVHSATKFLGGHHDLTAGVIVGPRSYLADVWDFSIISGSILGPFDGWLLLRGLKTLGLRVEQQNRNALALAQFLESHSKVERVNYPGLESHPQHSLARRQK